MAQLLALFIVTVFLLSSPASISATQQAKNNDLMGLHFPTNDSGSADKGSDSLALASSFTYIVFNNGTVPFADHFFMSHCCTTELTFVNTTDYIANSPRSSQNNNFHFDYKNYELVLLIIDTQNEDEFDIMVDNVKVEYGNRDAFDEPGNLKSKFLNEQLIILFIWPNSTANAEKGIQAGLKSISSEDFTLDTNIYVLFPNVSTATRHDLTKSQTQLWELYAIKDVIVTTMVATAEDDKERRLPNSFLNLLLLNEKILRRQNFQGVEMVPVAVGEEQGYPAEVKFVKRHFNEDLNSLNTGLESGYAVNLYRDLKYVLNFTEPSYAIRSTGYMSTNESIIYVRLENNEADICLSQHVYTERTYGLSTILQSTLPLRAMAFCKNPIFSLPTTMHFRVFNWKIWVNILLMIAILIVGLKILSWVRSNYVENIWSRWHVRIINEEAIIWGVGILCQQNWHIFPSSTSLKIAFQTASVFGLITYAAFIGTLVSRLSVHNVVFKSFDDIVNHNYTLVFNQESFSMGVYMKGLTQFRNIPDAIDSNWKQIEQVLMEGNSALVYYWDSISLLFANDTNTQLKNDHFFCSTILALPVENGFVPSGMVLKKGSPFKDIFNSKIIELKEYGLNQRHLQHYERDTQPICLSIDQFQHLQLGFPEMNVAFTFIWLGLLVSIIALAIERMLYRILAPKFKFIF